MIINDFLEKEIQISWTLLLICFESCNILKYCDFDKRFITAREILNYAAGLLETSDEADIISLAILEETDEEEILKLLKQLSASENYEYSTEFRKFRVMYIYKNLPDSNEEITQGLLKIYELWDIFNFPIDSPNLDFDFKNISYTRYIKLLEAHKKWIQNEFFLIRYVG